MDIFHRPYQAKNCHTRSKTRTEREDLQEGLNNFKDLNDAIGDMDDASKTFKFARSVTKWAKNITPFLGAAGAVAGTLFSLVEMLTPQEPDPVVTLIKEEFEKVHQKFDLIEESKTFDDICRLLLIIFRERFTI